jgi:hypothetical protein
MPLRLRGRREKVFGPGRAVPLDRNAKAHIADYARAWSARNCRDLWGREGWRWRVVRTSNAYVFRDPLASIAPHPAAGRRFPSKSENPPGTSRH